MARLLESLRRALGLSSSKTVPALPSFRRSIDTDFSVFREGDRVVIHGKSPLLTKPLTKGGRTEARRGVLEHDNIIGKRVWDPVKAYKGPEYRLSLPTLEEYVIYTPRLVTPIYAADANLIVSLLDIHVAPPAEGDRQPPLEILEAGTGHGSLTLHLARAIQAANTTPPPLPAKSQVRILKDHSSAAQPDAGKKNAKESNNDTATVDSIQQQWDAWRAQRRAVIHTVDVSPTFSAHAEQIVRGFRRGIYAGNVDFYVARVEDWIADQVRRRTPRGIFGRAGKVEPFLSYAILDMPSAHLRIPHVAPVLRRDGLLAVFMPSVTQIGECVDLIRRQRLPFVMERAVELGMGISSGRLWDIRYTVKKSRADPNSWVEQAPPKSSDEEPAAQQDDDVAEHGSGAGHGAVPGEAASKDDKSVLVCRPKVGERIVGGGFVGIWRKIEDKEH